MKKLMSLVPFILILSLAACAAPAGAGQSPPPSSSPTYTYPADLVASHSSPPVFIPDTNIPDIMISNEESVVISNHGMYEDDKYIYCLIEGSEGRYYLCSLGKSDDTTKRISDEYCICFTLYKGIIYYVDDIDSGNGAGTIASYDPATGKSKRINTLENGIYNITAYNDRLYFTYETVYDEEAEASVTDLYSIKLNGTDKKLIEKDVCTFSIYKDAVYYNQSGDAEGAALFRCGLDGSGTKQLLDWAGYDFRILNGRLYYSYYIDNDNADDQNTKDFIGAIDLTTYEKTDVLEGCYDFAPLGQYLLYVSDDAESIPYLRAYDSSTGKTYNLLELGPLYNLTDVPGGAYITRDDGFMNIATINIEGGTASLNEQMFNTEALKAAPIVYKQPSPDTVIIADSMGNVIGGYSGGKWLTHVEAAAYCGQTMTFCQYGLGGREATVNSSGVLAGDSDLSPSSGTISTEYDTDGDGGYVLNIAENDYSGYMFSAKPERFPKIEALPDTSNVQRAVQKRIDDNFKNDKVEARINEAVSADIDGDRENEIIFNAGNTNGEDDYFEDIERNWFSLSGFIDNDGSVNILQEYYSTGYAEDSGSVCICSIADIDGDGVCEFVAELGGYEAWATIVYKYNGKGFTQVLWYETSV